MVISVKIQLVKDDLSAASSLSFPDQYCDTARRLIFFHLNFVNDSRVETVGSLYICRIHHATQKKLSGLPTASCRNITSLILVLLHCMMECIRLSCRLWISTSIGRAPNRSCTMDFGALTGRDCRILKVDIWKRCNWLSWVLFRCKVSRLKSNLGKTYAWYILYDTLGGSDHYYNEHQLLLSWSCLTAIKTCYKILWKRLWEEW